MTVSRALRDHPDLAADTKQRIIIAAKKLGYTRQPLETPVPNPQSARRMGLVAYGSDTTFQSETPRRIYLAIQQECQRNGAETLVEFPSSEDMPMLIKKHAVDGVFLFGRYTPAAAKCFKDIPTLAVSSYIRHNQLPRIVADNMGGMREITEHLISLGHKRILFLGLDEGELTELYRERGDGYSLAMNAHGLKPTLRFHAGYDFTPCIGDIHQFTAVACATDGVAVALRTTLLARGLSLPGQCSLAGFDGTSEGEQLGLTSYSPDWAMLGKVAADLLLFRPQDIHDRAIKVTVPGKLIVRKSTRKPA